MNAFAQQEIPVFFDSELELRTLNVDRIAYSPNGNKIARTTSDTRKIVIWDFATGREIARLAGHNQVISGIIFSPNGRQLVSFDRSDSIKLWDIVTGTLIRNISQNMVVSVSFSPDGSRVAAAYSSSTSGDGVKIWNATNGNELLTLAHTARVFSVTYSPDGKYILTASMDGLRIWDSGNGQVIRTINGGSRFINAVFIPNGKYIAAGNNTGTSGVRIFNIDNGQELRSIPLLLYPNSIIEYSQDGRQLLFNAMDDNRNNIIKIYDPDIGQELRSFSNYNRAIASNLDERRILTESFIIPIEDKGYSASFVNIIDATTGRKVGTIGYGPLNIGAKAFADLQIARFLGDTAAVARHEAILQFITSRGDATRAEIEAFYRNNVRGLITEVVDREVGNSDVPRNSVNEIKQMISNFYLEPIQANYSAISNYYTNRKQSDERELQRIPNSSAANAANRLSRSITLSMITSDLYLILKRTLTTLDSRWIFDNERPILSK